MALDHLLSLPSLESRKAGPFGSCKRLRGQITGNSGSPGLSKLFGKYSAGSISYRRHRLARGNSGCKLTDYFDSGCDGHPRADFTTKAESTTMAVGHRHDGGIAVGGSPIFNGVLVRKPRADMRASPAAYSAHAPSELPAGLFQRS